MKELKAIEILKHNKNAMIKFINSFDDDCKEDGEYISGNKYIEELDEAIKELEELNNISCESCKYYKPQDYDLKEDILDQWIYCDWIYAETRDLVNFKKFYCSNYEAKGV